MKQPTSSDIAWLAEVVKRTGSFNIVKRKNYAGTKNQVFVYEARYAVSSIDLTNLKRLKRVVGSGNISENVQGGYNYFANSVGVRRILELVDINSLCSHKRDRAIIAEKFLKTVGKPVNESERATLHATMKSKMNKFPS